MCSVIRALKPCPVRGAGNTTLLATLTAQLLTGFLIALAYGSDPNPTPSPRELSAAVIVEPPLGGVARALSATDVVPADGRLQLSFEPSAGSWTAVLWFDGDHVVPLYPDPLQAEQGWTDAMTYAVPGPGQWLRLTPSRGEELLAVVSAPRPDPQVLAVLAGQTPSNVRSLRARLETASSSQHAGLDGVERYLPTPDGRAVAAPWRRAVGVGTLVLGWRITVDSSTWPAQSMSSSSAQALQEHSSPSVF